MPSAIQVANDLNDVLLKHNGKLVTDEISRLARQVASGDALYVDEARRRLSCFVNDSRLEHDFGIASAVNER